MLAGLSLNWALQLQIAFRTLEINKCILYIVKHNWRKKKKGKGEKREGKRKKGVKKENNRKKE